MNTIYNKFKQNFIIYILIFSSILLYLVLLARSQDNDMYFEIMSGKDILNGNFTTISHLDNFPVTIQQWLYSVTLCIFDRLGYAGHMLLVLLQNILLYVISYIFLNLKTKNKKLSMIAPYILLLYNFEYMINIRPQIITMIFLVTELILLELYKSKQQYRYILLLFPLLVLAANFHNGVFLYHIMIIMPYCIDMNKKLYIDFKLAISSILLCLCSICTPYGINGATYTIKAFISKTYNIFTINELETLDIFTFIGIKLLITVGITIYLIYKHRSNIYINTYIFGTFLLTLLNTRHISILYVGMLFLCCTINVNKLKSKYILGLTTIICFIFAFILVPNAKDIRNNHKDILSYIGEKDARIYNVDIDIGGYLEYNGYTKLSFDSRLENFSYIISGVENKLTDLYKLKTGYSIDKNQSYSLISNDEIYNIIEDYDYIICKETDYITRVLTYDNNSHWQKLYSNSNYIIWKKTL